MLSRLPKFDFTMFYEHSAGDTIGEIQRRHRVPAMVVLAAIHNARSRFRLGLSMVGLTGEPDLSLIDHHSGRNRRRFRRRQNRCGRSVISTHVPTIHTTAGVIGSATMSAVA
jgi:hypothetical protein